MKINSINYNFNTNNFKSSSITKDNNKPQVPNNTQNKVSYPCGFASNIAQVNFCGWRPKADEDKFKQIADLIKSDDVQKIAVSGHQLPDGDSVCSTIAMGNLIYEATGKDVDVFIFGELPEKYKFLDTNPHVKINPVLTTKEYKKDKLQEKYGQYDLALSLDTPLERMIPDNYLDGIFNNAKHTARIDHHPYMESYNSKKQAMVTSDYAGINLYNDNTDSASQLVMQFAEVMDVPPEKLKGTVSESIYSGLISDTNNFAYARGEDSFQDAVLLIQNGVDNQKMNKKIFGSIPKIVLDTRKHLYNSVQYTENGKVAYFEEDDKLAEIKKQAKEQGFKDDVSSEISSFMEELIKADGIEAAIKINGTNFSIRSKEKDISKIAESYGGGGHKNAAAFAVRKSDYPDIDIKQTVLKQYSDLCE